MKYQQLKISREKQKNKLKKKLYTKNVYKNSKIILL